MANKNRKNIRLAVRAAGKAGNSQITLEVPVPDWHNHPKSQFRPVTFHTARMNDDGVVSSAPRRNMQMRVLQNTNGNGGKDSITVHEPINKQDFVTHKNHAYIKNDKREKYFQTVK